MSVFKTPLRLVTLGVGAPASPRYAPAGLLLARGGKKRYAAKYHCVRPGVWQPAAGTADQLLACLLEHPGPARPVWPGRLLLDEHFEFRGDSPRKEPCCTRTGEW